MILVVLKLQNDALDILMNFWGFSSGGFRNFHDIQIVRTSSFAAVPFSFLSFGGPFFIRSSQIQESCLKKRTKMERLIKLNQQ